MRLRIAAAWILCCACSSSEGNDYMQEKCPRKEEDEHNCKQGTRKNIRYQLDVHARPLSDNSQTPPGGVIRHYMKDKNDTHTHTHTQGPLWTLL